MILAAFDIGIKNFAFAVVEGKTNVLFFHVQDLRGKKSEDAYKNLITYMDSYRSWWEKVDIVLIEKQLCKTNIVAGKLSCHLHAYFLHRHPDKIIIEYPSTYKTRLTNFPLKKSTHRQRKQYAIEYVLQRCQEEDPVVADWLSTYPKKDDICDCILMCETFYASPFVHRCVN